MESWRFHTISADSWVSDLEGGVKVRIYCEWTFHPTSAVSCVSDLEVAVSLGGILRKEIDHTS